MKVGVVNWDLNQVLARKFNVTEPPAIWFISLLLKYEYEGKPTLESLFGVADEKIYENYKARLASVSRDVAIGAVAYEYDSYEEIEFVKTELGDCRINSVHSEINKTEESRSNSNKSNTCLIILFALTTILYISLK